VKHLQAALLVLILCACGSDAADARTWRVARDGSGDFTDIQPAVDVSSAGDTIKIGPGRFDTFHSCVAPAWTEEAIVSVKQDDLTFIGSGKEVTIVGTETFYGEPGENPKGFCSIDGYDGVIQDMTIENVERGIYWYRGNLRVENCVFRGHYVDFGGLGVWLDGGIITNCEFDLGGNAKGCNIYSTSQDVTVQDCSFQGFSYGVSANNGTQNTIVRRCDFEGSYWAVQFDRFATGSIANSTFRDIDLWAIRVAYNSNVVINDVFIDGAESGLVISSGSVVEGTDIVVANTTDKGIWMFSEGRATIHRSHILPAAGLAVGCGAYLGDPVVLDMTGNYWGTTDPSAIAALIRDSNDDPDIHCTVEFLPIANGPVPTETTTWGSVKSMFR
jgi:hypothetical protein